MSTEMFFLSFSLQIKVAPLHSCQNMGMDLDCSMLAVFQTLREDDGNVIELIAFISSQTASD